MGLHVSIQSTRPQNELGLDSQQGVQLDPTHSPLMNEPLSSKVSHETCVRVLAVAACVVLYMKSHANSPYPFQKYANIHPKFYSLIESWLKYKKICRYRLRKNKLLFGQQTNRQNSDNISLTKFMLQTVHRLRIALLYWVLSKQF